MNIEFQTIGELFCSLGSGRETGKRSDFMLLQATF